MKTIKKLIPNFIKDFYLNYKLKHLLQKFKLMNAEQTFNYIYNNNLWG